jgi:3-oxoadipate CoA-transferase beta subunit
VRKCTYPLTALGAVKRVYTNLAVIDVTPRGFEVADMAPGLTFEALQARTEAKLHPKQP